MKATILTLTFILFTISLFGQNENPYSQFGYEAPVMPEKERPALQNRMDRLYLINADTTSKIHMLAIDPAKMSIIVFDKKGFVVQTDTLNRYTMTRWLSVDPYGQFSSPYVGMGNNPVKGADPNGGFCCISMEAIGEEFSMLAEDELRAGAIQLEGKVSMTTYLKDVTVIPDIDKAIVTKWTNFSSYFLKDFPLMGTRVLDPQTGWGKISDAFFGKRIFPDPIDGTNYQVDSRGYIDEPGYVGGTVDVGPGRVMKGLSYLKNPNVFKHIFRNAPGHVNPQTVASQSRYLDLFKKVSSSAENLVPTLNPGKIDAGVQTYIHTFRNGKQVWVETISGQINNAGVNLIPR